MSFRPTISIYLDDHIIDCGYYKNWEERDLLLECCHLAQKLDGCTSRREVMERLGRTYDVEEWEKGERHAFYMSFEQYPEEKRIHDSHVVERLHTFDEPASYTEDENLLHDVEQPSEFPVFIDLTDRCFYYSYVGLITDVEPGPIANAQEYDVAKDENGWLSDGARISFDLIEHIEATTDGDRLDGFLHADEGQKMIDVVAAFLGGALGESSERLEADPEREKAFEIARQAEALAKNRDYDRAIELYRTALDVLGNASDEDIEPLQLEAKIHHAMGAVLGCCGKFAEARMSFDSALVILQALGAKYAISEYTNPYQDEIASIIHAQKLLDRAEGPQSQGADDEKDVVQGLIDQGRDLLKSNHADDAIGVFQEALERQSSVSDGSGIDRLNEAQAHEGLASALHFSDKQHEEALAHFGTAAELYQRLDEEYEADFRDDIARCLLLGAKAAFLSYAFPDSLQKYADASLRFVKLADEGSEWAADMLEECLDDMVERSAFLRYRLWSSLSELHRDSERYRMQAARARLSLEKVEEQLEEASEALSLRRAGSPGFLTIEFGTYPQGADGELAPIRWRMIAAEGGRVLLLSEKALDCVPYNSPRFKCTWESCTLRSWLNGEFLKEAFNQDENSRIARIKLPNDNPFDHDAPSGPVTYDRIFCVSLQEMERYLGVPHENWNDVWHEQAPHLDLIATPTDWAVARGAHMYGEPGERCGVTYPAGGSHWWLRSPGRWPGEVSNVDHAGCVRCYHFLDDHVAVRPALWLNL